MKNLTSISLILFTMLATVSSCGEDGQDGKYYVKINNNASASSYWDNNSCVPYGMSYFVNYGPCTNVGSFSYEYQIPGWIWSGTYSVSINKGETGGTFSDGKDGSNRYYTLSLTNSGMTSTYSIDVNDDIILDSADETKMTDVFNTTSDHIDETIDFGTHSIHIIGDKYPAGSIPTHQPKYYQK